MGDSNDETPYSTRWGNAVGLTKLSEESFKSVTNIIIL